MTTLATLPKNGSDVTTSRKNNALPNLPSWVDDLFDGSLGTGFLSNFNTGMSIPAVNIKENKDEFIIEIAVPGMKKTDFNIDLDNKVLSISSETKDTYEEKNETYTRKEFGYSSFKRTFTLPDTVESDNIKAQYKDGILMIHLPKREEAKEKPAKRINIS